MLSIYCILFQTKLAFVRKRQLTIVKSHYSYNTIKTKIQGGNSKKPLGPSMHMFAAADAGVLTLLMTNPIWVVKTRLCLQYAEDVNLAESKRYRGLIDALKKIYKTEGIRGLYKVRECSVDFSLDWITTELCNKTRTFCCFLLVM